MAVKTFTWKVESGVVANIDYRVIETQFGDGYAQISADGINTKNESYGITVHAFKEEAKAIMAFFDEHKGVKSFFWTPPLGSIGLYTCKNPTPSDKGGGLYTISGTFVKVFSSIGAS